MKPTTHAHSGVDLLVIASIATIIALLAFAVGLSHHKSTCNGCHICTTK